MLLTYFLNDFEIVPVAPIINGITFVFTFHMRCISIVRSLYFRILSPFFKSHFCLLRLQRLYYYYYYYYYYSTGIKEFEGTTILVRIGQIL